MLALYKQLGAIGSDDGIMAARTYELDQQRDAQLAFNAAQSDAAKLKSAVDELAEQQRLMARQDLG